MPIIKFKSEADIPEGLRDNAKQENGEFVVDVVLTAKLDEFRNKNVEVLKERDALKNKVSAYEAVVGEDPETFKGELNDLRNTNQLVKDGKLKGSSAIEEEVTRRVASVKADYDGKVQALAADRDKEKARADGAEGKLRRTFIDAAVTQAVLAEDSGVNVASLPDVLARAHSVFSYENDKVIAKIGDVIQYGRDGVSPMTPKEWIGKLLVEAPYFSKNSSGGGASGGADSKLPQGYSQGDWDKLDPAERIRLSRQASR